MIKSCSFRHKIIVSSRSDTLPKLLAAATGAEHVDWTYEWLDGGKLEFGFIDEKGKAVFFALWLLLSE